MVGSLSGFSRADKYRSLLGDNECGSFGQEGMALGGGLQENVRLSGLNFDETIAAAKKPGFKSFTMKAKSKVILNVKMTVGESHNGGGLFYRART